MAVLDINDVSVLPTESKYKSVGAAINSIKLKPSTARKTITYRERMLNRMLEFAKRDLANTTIPNSSENGGKLTERQENKIYRKAATIAKLEEKIQILSKKSVPSTYVKRRAIRIKDNMIKGLRFNTDSAYAVPEDKKESIFASDIKTVSKNEVAANPTGYSPVDPEKVVEQTEEKLGAEVRSIMETENTQPLRDEVIVTPTRNEVSEQIKNAFDEAAAKEEARVITTEEVASVVGEQMSVVETEPSQEVISAEETEDVIAHELGKLRVQNGQRAAKLHIPHIPTVEQVVEVVDKDTIKKEIDSLLDGIDLGPTPQAVAQEPIFNDVVVDNVESKTDDYPIVGKDEFVDGQYRKRAEDMDEDFRKLKIEPKKPAKQKLTFKDMLEYYGVEMPAEEKGINDDIFGNNQRVINTDNLISSDSQLSEEDLEQINNELESPRKVEEQKVEENLHFDYNQATVGDLTQAVDKAQSINDIEAMLARVNELKQKQSETKAKAEEAKARAQEKERQKIEALEKLRAYQEALEEDCMVNEQIANENLRTAQSNENDINQILNAISPAAYNVTVEENHHVR